MRVRRGNVRKARGACSVTPAVHDRLGNRGRAQGHCSQLAKIVKLCPLEGKGYHSFRKSNDRNLRLNRTAHQPRIPISRRWRRRLSNLDIS